MDWALSSDCSEHCRGLDCPVPRWSTRTTSRNSRTLATNPASGKASAALCPGPPARAKNGSGSDFALIAGSRMIYRAILRPLRNRRFSYTSYFPHSPSVLPSDVWHGSSVTLPRVLGLSVDLAAAPGRRNERGTELPPWRHVPTSSLPSSLSFAS